jgi:tRNA 2-selenouridine synthase
MSVICINVEEFLQSAASHPVLDVRSPGEYLHAHIPGAYSLPLFTDEERKIVGTAYTQENKEKAIKLGLQYFGGKMVKLIEEVEKIVMEYNVEAKGDLSDQEVSKTVLIHCWRGGMRSAGVAWLLDLYGFKVVTLVGGYKAYRNWVLKQFEREYNLRIVSGYTGSGKTKLLLALKQQGRTIIDLEALASHKGSAFGDLGMPPQPSQEMFENELSQKLREQSKNDDLIFIEDESQRIGLVNIPTVFFKQMETSPVLFFDIPFEERLNNIVEEYGVHKTADLVNAIMRIKKKLGGTETKNAITHLIENNTKECFRGLLTYYDKWYLKGLHKREALSLSITTIKASTVDELGNSKILIYELQKENI